jgi:hypothetical protein
MLLEEIEAEIDLVTRTGARAMEGRDFDGAREALGRAGQLSGLLRPSRGSRPLSCVVRRQVRL